ncbi:MAG: response regulator transcription factor [Oligoflexia bacterium]|nr:response regulator transcription factor [Oligoflexia bacterium]
MAQIVIIEDEPSVAASVRFALDREGLSTIWASSGREGLNHISENTSLIILDIGLPDETGFEICTKIRDRWSIPIIYLTARIEDRDMIKAFDLGGDDYVTKPFKLEVLVARIKAHLRRNFRDEEVSSHTNTSKMPFQIDEGKKIISYFEQKLDLTKSEFQLLKCLIQKPGWVYSRNQLLESIWDENNNSTNRAIDTHIKLLRQKLLKVNNHIQSIITHRGHGYSINDKW